MNVSLGSSRIGQKTVGEGNHLERRLLRIAAGIVHFEGSARRSSLLRRAFLFNTTKRAHAGEEVNVSGLNCENMDRGEARRFGASRLSKSIPRHGACFQTWLTGDTMGQRGTEIIGGCGW